MSQNGLKKEIFFADLRNSFEEQWSTDFPSTSDDLDNVSYKYFINEDFKKTLKTCINEEIDCYISDIKITILQDEFIDGEVSRSELFMEDAYKNNQINYVMEALMNIYYSNLDNAHILEGILVMISSLPYEVVEPKGQIMAMGLLTNKELIVRDRAIQCFERWNSKKGLKVLKNIQCEPNWLQEYVNKIIIYIEKEGLE